MSTELQTINLDGGYFYYCDDKPCVKIGQNRFELAQESFDALLNLLKIPTKYQHRFASEDAEFAGKNVNFWLSKRGSDVALAVRGDEVINVVESDRNFVSATKVISTLAKYLKCSSPFITNEGDLIVALFKTNEPTVELENGERGFFSIRLTYSECFAITPRIDGVFTVESSFENYYYPIQGRKFRVSNAGESYITNEMIEFVDVVLVQMQKDFIPALNKMIAYDAKLNIYGFAERLCSELRLPKRFILPLISGIEDTEVSLHILVRLISNNLLPEVRNEMIDYMAARDIEIALSKAIVCGRFR